MTATCVETLYSAFARAYKQGGMDGTSARQLNHRQALICMFLRFPRDTVPQRGVLNDFLHILQGSSVKNLFGSNNKEIYCCLKKRFER